MISLQKANGYCERVHEKEHVCFLGINLICVLQMPHFTLILYTNKRHISVNTKELSVTKPSNIQIQK